MPSINIDVDFFSHPKVVRLVGLLGRGAEVLPIRIWCWCAKYHAEDGRLTGYSAQEIESAMSWWGKTGELVRAMVKVKLLEKDGDSFVVHDWMEHQGHVGALQERARKAAKARWNRLRDGEQADASSIANPMLEQCSILSIPPEPSKLKEEDSVTRSHATDAHDLAKQEFVLRLHDDEFPMFCSSVMQMIQKENEGRNGHGFSWMPRPKSTFEKDMRGLIYSMKDDEKLKILIEGWNLHKGKTNWCEHLKIGILYLVRATRKSRITSHYGFMYNILKQPTKLYSEKVDGILA